jgi:kynurenine formamidase
MEIVSSMKVFPGSPQPLFITWSKVETHGYASETMFLSTHTGTHIDAPSHFIQDSKTVDQLDVDKFVSRAILITTPKKADQQITRSDIINGLKRITTCITILDYRVKPRNTWLATE